VNNKNTAAVLENNLITLVVKAKVNIDEKKIDPVQFFDADTPLRAAFDLFGALFHNYGNPRLELFQPSFKKIEGLFKDVERIVLGIFRPHVQDKTMNKLIFIFSFIANVEFYNKVWANSDLYFELFTLINAMSKYTQFHYHLDERR